MSYDVARLQLMAPIDLWQNYPHFLGLYLSVRQKLTILQDDNAEHFGLSSCFCLSVKVGKIALFIKIPTSEVD